MDNKYILKNYKIHLKQERETDLSVLAHDEDEAKYVAELASKSTMFYELEWDLNHYDFDFISESTCIYKNYEQASCSEWIRQKKRNGYSYNAVLKGVLENYDFENNLAIDMMLASWFTDGSKEERKIIHAIANGRDFGADYNKMLLYLVNNLHFDEEKARRILSEYWSDKEHPLPDDLDYGDRPEMPEYWY